MNFKDQKWISVQFWTKQSVKVLFISYQGKEEIIMFSLSTQLSHYQAISLIQCHLLLLLQKTCHYPCRIVVLRPEMRWILWDNSFFISIVTLPPPLNNKNMKVLKRFNLLSYVGTFLNRGFLKYYFGQIIIIIDSFAS